MESRIVPCKVMSIVSGDKTQIQKSVKPTTEVPATNQAPETEVPLYDGMGLISPPYDPWLILKEPEINNILQPLIDAYKTNIPGFGYGIKSAVNLDSKSIKKELKDEIKNEMATLDFFYKYCNMDTGFGTILGRAIGDREQIGWGTIEVIQDVKGKPAGFEYIPAYTVRVSKVHPDAVTIKAKVIGPDGAPRTIQYQKRFRRFCQYIPETSTYIWFKELGDPRNLDKTTGKFEYETDNDGNRVKYPIADGNIASSIIYLDIPVSYSPYGVPRWMGNLLGIKGSRKSEELNLNYFIRGRHIPLAILVKNGSLSESSVNVIQEHVNSLTGSDNAFGYLVLEAEPFEDDTAGLDDKNSGSNVDIDIKPLTEAIQTDGLFQDYDKNCRDKIRGSFRLPPIYIGDSSDYTRATADTARAIAEEQIFNPERKAIAEIFNRIINPALGILYAEMYLNSPDLSNKKELAEAVGIYGKLGAITPNMLNNALSDLLDKNIEAVPEEWANLPIAVVLEMVKQKQGSTIGLGDPIPDDTTAEPTEDPTTDTTTETKATTGGKSDE